MKVVQKLDSNYQELLESYAGLIRQNMPQVEEYALLSKSIAYRDVLATAVVGSGITYREFIENLDYLKKLDIDSKTLAVLGRIVALQNIDAEDRSNGLLLLQTANKQLPKIKPLQKYRQLEFELKYETGAYKKAVEYLNENRELTEIHDGYLEIDLHNPFSGNGKMDYTSWLQGFNKIFEINNRAPVNLSGEATHPFDRLSVFNDSIEKVDGPLVSVIMTSYQPEPEAFTAAARSILNQTWKNLELIIVDDASPNRKINLLEKLAAEDARVKLVLLNENGGTYRARNVGLKIATGEFVTGQDSDDWSHPERIEAQVKYMLENPETAGVVTSAVRTDENLCRIMPGLNPTRRCEVSFMTPLKLALEVGGYLDARKAADSEFRQRVEFYSQKTVGVISDPLYVIRLMPNSLSRGDFSAGWSHQSRRAFWNATLFWHTNASASELCLKDGQQKPLPIPPRFQIARPMPIQLDIVIAADWRVSNGWQRAMVDEVNALIIGGFSVGIMQMESPNSNTRTSKKPGLAIQELINNGTVIQITSDQESKISNLILHDPSIIQFPSGQASNLDIERVLIVPFEPACDLNGKNIRYLHEACTLNAENYFSANVEWSFVNSNSHSSDTAEIHGIRILDETWPIALDITKWHGREFRNNKSPMVPVIGRNCENLDMHWPDKDAIQKLWPIDSSAEVWILGDARGALRKLDTKYFAENWVSFREGEIRPHDYMKAIDFFVYFPSEESAQNLCREALEASASGRTVILPEQFRNTHGDSAIYSDVDGVPELINLYFRNRDLYLKQSQIAKIALNNIFGSKARQVEKFQEIFGTKSKGIVS